MRGIVMRGQEDEVTLFASPPKVAREMGLQSSLSVIIDIINSAKKTLFITCYEFSSKDLTELLIRAVERGVFIDLYIDDSNDSRIQRSVKNLKKLNDIGVRIVRRNSSTSDNHTKAIIADSRTGIIGSANFTRSGMERNIEIGLKLTGPTCRIFVDKFILGLEGMSDHD